MSHEPQATSQPTYLIATGKPIGLVLNFGKTTVDVKRKVKELASKKNKFYGLVKILFAQ